MGFADILALATVEVYGDFNLRWFAQTDKVSFLWRGLLGYAAVIYFLIRSLRTKNVLYVNGVWDGLSGVIESIAAFYYLGDRLSSLQQYMGLGLTIVGVVLMKLG